MEELFEAYKRLDESDKIKFDRDVNIFKELKKLDEIESRIIIAQYIMDNFTYSAGLPLFSSEWLRETY
jgi:hypothetical protein